jgi:hypothetical protein
MLYVAYAGKKSLRTVKHKESIRCPKTAVIHVHQYLIAHYSLCTTEFTVRQTLEQLAQSVPVLLSQQSFYIVA